MKINFNFSKIFDNDKLVRIISLILGIIVWLVVSITVNPNDTRLIGEIPINFDLTKTVPEEYGLSVIEGQQQTVDIKVEGKKYKVSKLTKHDFIATPILSQVNKAGEYELEIVVKKANERDEDYFIVPSTQKVKVTFDRVVDREFKLIAVAENIHAKEGFIREQPTTTPERIMLNGPLTEIDKIKKCVVYTDERITSDKTEILEGNLVFFDENNNRLDLKNVTYQTQKFEITVPIQKHKVVPLTVGFVNAPPGFDTTKLKYTMSEQTIEISGPKDIVDECKSISLGTIDLRRADIGSTFSFDVNLFAGINNVNNINTVDITMAIEGLDTKIFNIPHANIITQNTPASYDINIKSYSVNNVKIVGNVKDMEKLAANDLIAVVDFNMREITEGSSRVPITIYATGNKFVWPVGEYSVLISVKKSS